MEPNCTTFASQLGKTPFNKQIPDTLRNFCFCLCSSLGTFPNRDGAKSARFNNIGSRLLCSEVDQPLTCYDIPTNRQMECLYFSDPGYEIKSNLKVKSPCCFAGVDDELIVCASDDNNIYIWPIPEGESDFQTIDQPLRVLCGHRDIIRSVRYNNRMGLLASCGEEGIVKLWSTDAI